MMRLSLNTQQKQNLWLSAGSVEAGCAGVGKYVIIYLLTVNRHKRNTVSDTVMVWAFIVFS